MSRLTVALVALIALVALAAGLAPRKPTGVSAAPTEASVKDLLSALRLRGFCHELTFDPPVSGVHVQLCELRRQADGGWQRTPLAERFGCFQLDPIDRMDVSLILPDEPTGEFFLRLDDTYGNMSLLATPDFTDTYTTPGSARFIENCLVLAAEERDPNRLYGREEDLVRFIGLEITSE